MTEPLANGKLSLNLELLIKLLKLTTSSNDSEALLAGRKANEQLLKFGGDWEALLRGKVTVIADPFSAPAPTQEQMVRRSAAPPPPPPPRPKAAAPTPQAAAQTPYRRPPPSWPRQTPKPAQPSTPTASPPAMSRNTLRKQRVQLDDLA